MMQLLDAAATKAVLPYSGLADSIAAVLRDKADGKAYAPARTSVPLPGGGLLLLMPAADEQIGITKLVTVHTGNSGSNLPVVQADVLVFEAATGKRLFLLDGATVTARRTAALSLLAARTLAPDSSGPLLIVGAGTQGRGHLEAFIEGLGISEVYIASGSIAHAEALAQYARVLGADAHAVSRPDEVLDRATFIVTATTSPTPVLPSNVRDDALIIAVGAYTPTMAELPRELVRRARLYVDTLEGAQAEAGDLIRAGVDWSKVIPLEQALDMPRHRQDGPIIFKSVGHALWDLAAARMVVDNRKKISEIRKED